uniref:Family with sequence similarity 13 member B n=1 Tax=Salmo trutta TaxID=8032 RepID=A0A674CY87_SALTR
MRKSLSPSPSDSLTPARVFGVPLDGVQQSGQPGQEVPLLVRHIVEYIEEHGRLDLEGLFLVNGNAERVEWLRQRYDSGEEVDLEKEADLASAVSLLRLFLQELPEPIIPAGMQSHILQLYQDYSSEEELARNMKYFLQQLPQVNYSLLRFLCRFLSSVASLQEESWSVGALAAVFGPDIFHLDTDVEDLKEQESVSRILAELLENQEEFFDSEDDDVSTTDYSSINEQITELLDDEKLEACEELPQDGEGEEGSASESPQHSNTQVTPSSSSHISPISVLPGSADIIERTIRAAVEQHFFDLKSSIDQDISNSSVFIFVSRPDPVPAYKSWQDESDSGEAQLSPLAGRMVPLPHEEDAHPLMARRFLDFGHSQRFLQHSDPDATSPTKAHHSLGRPRRASFSSKESGLRNDSVSHQLTKKLQSLKKKIKQFEEQFENERNYKPSHGDRAANPKVLKWMTDLTKIRKQLKGKSSLCVCMLFSSHFLFFSTSITLVRSLSICLMRSTGHTEAHPTVSGVWQCVMYSVVLSFGCEFCGEHLCGWESSQCVEAGFLEWTWSLRTCLFMTLQKYLRADRLVCFICCSSILSCGFRQTCSSG